MNPNPQKEHKELVKIVYEFLISCLLPNQKIIEVRIEEVVPFEKEEETRIVLSYKTVLENGFGGGEREYKEFDITNEGIVQRMCINR